MDKEYSGIEDRQSYVSTSGKNWEIVVMDFVNDYFSKNSIPLNVIRGRGLKNKHKELWNNLAIPVKDGKVEGDVDLVVVHTEKSTSPSCSY